MNKKSFFLVLIILSFSITNCESNSENEINFRAGGDYAAEYVVDPEIGCGLEKDWKVVYKRFTKVKVEGKGFSKGAKKYVKKFLERQYHMAILEDADCIIASEELARSFYVFVAILDHYKEQASKLSSKETQTLLESEKRLDHVFYDLFGIILK